MKHYLQLSTISPLVLLLALAEGTGNGSILPIASADEPDRVRVATRFELDPAYQTVESPSDRKETLVDPSKQSLRRKNISQLLDVESMVGPMNDAATTLSRIDQNPNWLNDKRTIPDGVRPEYSDYSMPPMSFTWASPVFHHRPLYFEQPNLERYGNGTCRIAQPIASSAHFLLSVPLMPFKMIYNPPWADVYTLGEGRPGDPRRLQSLRDVLLYE